MASPFASDNLGAFSTDTQQDARKQKLAQYSRATLSDLSRFANEPDDTADSLESAPLNSGNLSKNNSIDTGAGEPSQIATERVQRAPSLQEASPLLSTNERAGNVLTGEEGAYGPLTSQQRGVSLKDFFGPSSAATFGQNADAFAPQDPGTAYRNVQQAKGAYGYANQADQATGGNVRDAASDSITALYKQLFPSSRGETGGTSLSDTVRSGAGAGAGEGAAGVGYGAGQSLISPADQAAGYYYGASIAPDALPALAETGAETGAAAGAEAGAGAAGDAASTAAGTSLGAASGIVGLYSLATGLYRMLAAEGEGPTSGNQWADLGFSLIPVLGDVLKEFTKGAWTPSKDWTNFGGRLGVTLNNENRGLQNLLYAVTNAKNRGDLTQAAQMFRHEIGGEGPNPGTGYVGGYSLAPNAENGAPQIGGLPGASGKRHEWGIEANFDNPVGATNQLLAALYSQLPEGQAAPLSEAAFNAAVSDPEYAQYVDAYNQIMGGATPDVSAYRPHLQDLIRQSVAAGKQQQAAAKQTAYNPGDTTLNL